MVSENGFGKKREIYEVDHKLLLKCMWRKKVMPEDLAKMLDITVHELFYKMYMGNGFTKEEINKISRILELNNIELDRLKLKGDNNES